MRWLPFASAVFGQGSYSNGYLVLTFHRKGRTYVYSGVPESAWKDLRKAELHGSAGAYFNARIATSYPYKQVTL